MLICFQEHHGAEYRKYEAQRATTTTAGRKRKLQDETKSNATSCSSTDQNPSVSKPKCQGLVSDIFSKRSSKPLTQAEFEENLARMLVEDMQPLATVERSGFIKFCAAVLPQFTLPSRRTMGRRLDELYAAEKLSLMSTLSNTRWVSATADIWSSHKKAYMGVTIHFVHPETLQMVSSALACRRFKGAHTAPRIADILSSIFTEFHIESKLQNVVTDNASNFSKAFTLFHSKDGSSTDHVGDDAEDALSVVDVDQIMTAATEDDSDEVPILPPHKRCGNHSLNLVASVDALAARLDKTYQRSYDRAMSKVQALSNMVSKSPKANDTVEEITGKTFLKPTCTRWCSEYYAVERVVEVGLNKVIECQKALGQSEMTPADMKFLVAFLNVMRPLVVAMKLIEGENHCYIGQLIPTIMGLKRKLESASDVSMKPLTCALLKGIENRFQPIMISDEHRMATILHPKFKLAFLQNEQERMQGRQLLLTYVQQVQREVAGPAVSVSVSALIESEDDEDLYSFLNKPAESNSSLSDEVIRFNVCSNTLIF